MSEPELLQNFMKEQESLLYYSHYHHDSDSNEIAFTVCLSTAWLLEKQQEFSPTVIGLDSVWKYTKYNIPLWVITAKTPYGGIVVAFIFSTDASHCQLKASLQKLFPRVDSASKLMVMIDHDEVERKALVEAGVCSFLRLLLIVSFNQSCATFIHRKPGKKRQSISLLLVSSTILLLKS